MGTVSSVSRRRRRARRPPSVAVLRIGHRPGRDPRLSTHVALTARAFGAERLYLHPGDADLEKRVASVVGRFGGRFEVTGVGDYRPLLRGFPGTVVHLTMYGEPIDRRLPTLQRSRRCLVVVGGPKVPPDVYAAADVNLAVGSQPHSEVAALAVFLDRLRGIPTARSFRGARQRIVPQRRGKRVLSRADGAT